MQTIRAAERTQSSMEVVIGYVLLTGVLASAALMAAGLAWQWGTRGASPLESSVPHADLARFIAMELREATSGTIQPRLLIRVGLAVLMLTPYVRVAASLLFFAVAERNIKYTVFTGFVFAVLTYSLFLR